MSGGRPALWSGVAGAPFAGSGWYVLFVDAPNAVPADLGWPLLAFGAVVVATGAFVRLADDPPAPDLRADEEVVETRRASQRAAAVRTAVGAPPLAVAAYVLFATQAPYLYVVPPLVVGLYLFWTGLQAYWTNAVTTYYLTNRRVVACYRLLSPVSRTASLESLRSVDVDVSILDRLAGVGDVRLTDAVGADPVVVRSVGDPERYADLIRELR